MLCQYYSNFCLKNKARKMAKQKLNTDKNICIPHFHTNCGKLNKDKTSIKQTFFLSFN
jgi:hypothetical protein